MSRNQGRPKRPSLHMQASSLRWRQIGPEGSDWEERSDDSLSPKASCSAVGTCESLVRKALARRP
jgi:hypothetical protein